MLQIRVYGLGELKRIEANLQKMIARARLEDLHADAGWWMQREIKSAFKGPFSPILPYPRRFRYGKPPLLDERKLYNSISYSSSTSFAIAGTADPAAALHDLPPGSSRIILPHGKWLVFPKSPPLTPSEARLYNNRRIPGGFFLPRDGGGGTKKHRNQTAEVVGGYQGPGVYRKRSDGKIEMVKIAVKSSRSVSRPITTPVYNRLQEVADRWVMRITEGRYSQNKASANGNPLVRRR